MFKEWTDYIEHLVKIGRKSTAEMTQFELQHITGLFMRQEILELKEQKQCVSTTLLFNYLISNEEEDGKKLLDRIKSDAISCYKNIITFALDKGFNEKKEPDNK